MAAPLTGFVHTHVQYQQCFQGSSTPVPSRFVQATAAFLTWCSCKLWDKQGDTNSGPACKGQETSLLQRCFSSGLWFFTAWSQPSKCPELSLPALLTMKYCIFDPYRQGSHWNEDTIVLGLRLSHFSRSYSLTLYQNNFRKCVSVRTT